MRPLRPPPPPPPRPAPSARLLFLQRRPLVVDVAVLEVERRVVEGGVVFVEQQVGLRLALGLALLLGLTPGGLAP